MAESVSGSAHSGHSSWLAWILATLVCVGALIELGLAASNLPEDVSISQQASGLAEGALPIVFAVVAALIISRQPANRIGWLLMTPAVTLVAVGPIDTYLGSFTTAPAPTVANSLMIWFQSWSWLLFIFPLFFIILLFPTGRPPSPRWRWVLAYAVGMMVVLVLFAGLAQHFQFDDSWKMSNPIGFISDDPASMEYFIVPWALNLGLLTILSAASLFVRYRRAPAEQRLQIKWLLFASGIFAVDYLPGVAWQGNMPGLAGDLSSLLLFPLVALFPISIAIAILRHRLWDIDVIIRKTLIYSLLTVLLALVFLGSVVLLQQVVSRFAGAEDSPLVVVISTLAIAALFTPMRRFIQNLIDRRFYRKNYEGARILERFAATTLYEVEVEQLGAHLLSVVDEALKPETVSLWLIAGKK